VKKLSILFTLLLINSFTFSQVEVSTRLMDVLDKSKPDEYIRTLVLLRDQVNIQELDARLYDQKASLERRAFEVITALQQKALSTQGNLLSYLQEKTETREVFTYESFWISNLIMVEGKSSVILELMNRMDISQMDLDAILVLDEPQKIADNVPQTESVEPGIKIINADKLWALGITGAGRLAMGMDTGVGVNHPALNYKWRGTHVPSWQAWFDPSSHTTSPNDCDGSTHGTHTMGTMVGRSNTTGDTTGVAIDAEWIASNSLCGGGTHTSRSIASFQWAMNPDSNVNTINDMPDAINNSWYDPDVSNECSGIYKTTLDAVEAAGIAVVFSAGNNGPNASTITKPKNINTDEVNVFCVGAISGSSYQGGSNDPVASFSSRGPSLCGGTGSLLIKPEVSAPGVSVRSASGSSSYALLSGTSMASPHVTGAIVLLRQFAPNLTGKQIKLALYNTAKDLGVAGEDNVYGRGLIDVYAAFLSLGTPDTVAPDAITDLSTGSPTSNSLMLQWTVPNDTSLNGVTGYDIRYSTSPITDTTSFYAATQIPFPGTPDSTGNTETLIIEGLNFSTTYHFAIRSRDVWSNWSALSNPASGTTYGAPDIDVDPDSFSVTVSPNTVVKDTLVISNISSGNSTLDYEITLENNTFPEGVIDLRFIPSPVSSEKIYDKDELDDTHGFSFEGFGGPDTFGYEWIDSDEPAGPVYEWNDISATGTLASTWTSTGTFDPKDEGYAGPFPLGFNFKFYGEVKTQVYVSSNGFLVFNALTANAFTNAQIPSSAVPNGIISPFWDDLDGRTQGTVHYKQDGNRFIVQFTNWQKYSAQGSLTFQIVLYSSGKILFYYNNMNATLTSATVGIESPSGTDGLSVAYNAAYVKNNLAVKFAAEPDWLSNNNPAGRLYNGNSVNVELTFRSEDYPLGDYSMDLVIESNDPVTPSVTVPVKMHNLVIPVELTSLSAEQVKNETLIKWTTATEINNSGFSIEKRNVNEKENWIEAGFVKGNGNSTETKHYTYSDKNVQVGKYLYRLKQIDYDGSFEYSNEIEIEIIAPKEFSLYQNYPNPFNPSTTIEYTLPEKSEVTLLIYSSLGELITSLVNKNEEAGYHQVTFDALTLTSGTYIYQLKAKSENGNFVQTKKMILIK
jgi:subtilisin family serine protease